MKLKRVAVKDQTYVLIDRDTNDIVARVTKTGSHLDNYPWDYWIEDEFDLLRLDGTPMPRTGVTDTLFNAVDRIGANAVKRPVLSADELAIDLVARITGTVDSDSTPGYYEAVRRVIELAQLAVKAGLND